MFFLRLIVGIGFNVALFAIPLFLPAGTLHWWRGWVIVALVLIGTVGAIVGLVSGHRELLEERLKPPVQKDQPLADKILLLSLLTTFLGLLVFTSLDANRLHLMLRPGTFASSLGLVLCVAGWCCAYLGLRENAFAVSVVRHQQERNQVVVDTGPYSIVRHPLYAGGLLLIVGIPLWLESYAGSLAAVAVITTLVLRIVFEERFLRRELSGYEAYAERVRYRLVPFLW